MSLWERCSLVLQKRRTVGIGASGQVKMRRGQIALAAGSLEAGAKVRATMDSLVVLGFTLVQNILLIHHLFHRRRDLPRKETIQRGRLGKVEPPKHLA